MSGSETSLARIRSRLAANDSSVPALRIHARIVPNAAAIQAAATAVQNDSKLAPGTRYNARYITSAWPKTVARATATQPIKELRPTRTGRTIAPTMPVTAAARSRGVHEV